MKNIMYGFIKIIISRLSVKKIFFYYTQKACEKLYTFTEI